MKVKKRSRADYYIRVQFYPKDSLARADVWFCRVDGPVHASLMHGVVSEKTAEALIEYFEELGVRVEREKSKIRVGPPRISQGKKGGFF